MFSVGYILDAAPIPYRMTRPGNMVTNPAIDMVKAELLAQDDFRKLSVKWQQYLWDNPYLLKATDILRLQERGELGYDPPEGWFA